MAERSTVGIGVVIGDLASAPNSPDFTGDDASAERNPMTSLAASKAWFARADRAGFDTAWVPQAHFGVDALTAISCADEAPRIEFATAVTPIFNRHPHALAQEALTAQAATGNRVVLGLGLAHPDIVEDIFRIPFERPAAQMQQFLEHLNELFADVGEAGARLRVMGCEAPSVLLGALGPRMLALAGGLADGTVVAYVGPRTLERFTVPRITAAAAEAARAAPRVAVELPVWVTDDPAAAREQLATSLARYQERPSYAAMFEREGISGPAEVALVGDEATVERDIRSLAGAGATDIGGILFGDAVAQQRAWDLLRSLVGAV